MDNASEHPQAHELAVDGIKVLFFLPNTTSLLQPMDQGVNRMFKVYYTRKCMQCIVACHGG